MGHLPCLAHPMLSAAIVLRDRVIQGEYPVPSIPYEAWGNTPVVCSALAFLFVLFSHATLLFLGLADLILSLMVAVVLRTPPVVPRPRYLADGLTEVETPFLA